MKAEAGMRSSSPVPGQHATKRINLDFRHLLNTSGGEIEQRREREREGERERERERERARERGRGQMRTIGSAFGELWNK